MTNKALTNWAGKILLGAILAAPAFAVQITFTGGQAYYPDGSYVVTNNTMNYSNVDYYIENGFKLDFINSNEFVGDYYHEENDVIHGHWPNMTGIKVTQVDGQAFDLNYFILTTNNGTGTVSIHASQDGETSSYSQALPYENWGFPATQVYLGPQFDGIKAFWFTNSDTQNFSCFGMDSFYINEAAPPMEGVPEPSTMGLLGAGIGAFALRKLRR